MTWEYDVVSVGDTAAHTKAMQMKDILNKHGKEGWRLWGFREGYAIMERVPHMESLPMSVED